MNTTLLVIYASRTLAICLRYTFESIQIVDSLNNSLRHSSTLWQFVPSYGPLAASWVRLSIPDYWLRHVIDSLYVGNHSDGLWITSLAGPLMWSEVFFFSLRHTTFHIVIQSVCWGFRPRNTVQNFHSENGFRESCLPGALHICFSIRESSFPSR